MDPITRYNQERWEALAQADVPYSRPMLDLTTASARELLDPTNIMGEVNGKRVLCLAASGGQQSAAFGLLGAQVSVLDFSATQLQRDRETAAHYGLTVETVQGDMRDLSHFPDDAFDIVWHAHSIVFIPDVEPVFNEVARVLQPGGLYRMSCHNPYVHGLEERDWDGKGYSLWRPYIDSGEVVYADTNWDIGYADGSTRRVEGPREFRHSLSGIVNGLARRGFIILGLWEELCRDPQAQPGTWEHLKLIAPPWITLWTRFRPDVIDR
ncbi:MAG: class I SAM-dependent methyltransferase [Chloroflexi bacterium]|nr:class I SAM-dependent methyltransferase [Chloroflexota bacterium]MCL5273502.1 class I SAM-dependent methyltransferase [Chloroflexota bacterium]